MDKYNILLGEIVESEDCIPRGTTKENNGDLNEYGLRTLYYKYTIDYGRKIIDNEPAFYTYNCEANIKIKVNKELKNLPIEIHLQSESENNKDLDLDFNSKSNAVSEIKPKPNSELKLKPEPEYKPESRPNLNPKLRSKIRPKPNSEFKLKLGSILDLGDINTIENYSNNGYSNLGNGIDSRNKIPTGSALAGPKNDYNVYQGHLYTDRLKYLRTELEKKYNINNINQISYALAVDINYIECNPLIRSTLQQETDDGTLSLLVDRRALI
ncbi:hypothetical protein BKA59DRAFT_447800 [Fusarium tricinctum]|uniref:Uncharacterized protein n=1 Tax=Fusarium tricinctum TaxID=61284 RepID=A0A8K0WHQ8_9HYPO|nr:hypothetical protein BKA59DRAFT_447800 [Fusarium tricinctum]